MAKIKIAVDDGHGLKTAGKRSPKFPDGTIIKENEFNMPTADKLVSALQRCGFLTILLSPGTRDTSLSERVKRANAYDADAMVSIHFNAFRGKWSPEGSTAQGISTYSYRGSKKGKLLAQTVHGFLVKGTKQRNRGTKTSGFYVLKFTKMPAILCECGFMDYKAEALLMKDDDFQTEVAEEICQGMCAYFKVKYIGPEVKEDDIDYAIEVAKLNTQIEEMDLLLKVASAKVEKAENVNRLNQTMIEQVNTLNLNHAEKLRQIHQISELN